MLAVQIFAGVTGLRLLMTSLTNRTTSPSMHTAITPLLQSIREAIGLRAPATLPASVEALLGDRADVERMLNAQLMVGIIMLGLSGLLIAVVGPWALFPSSAGMVGAVRFPAIWLRMRIGAARREVRNDAPKNVELLATLLASGLPGEEAFATAMRSGMSSWRPLWARAVKGVRKGTAAPAALSQAVAEAGLIELLTITNSWRRCLQLGLPVADQLFDAAAGLRAAHNAARLRRAGRVGPVATLVIAMVIAPATVAFLATLLVAGVAGQGFAH